MSLTELFEKIGHDSSIRLKVWIENEKDDYIYGYLCALEDLKIIAYTDVLLLCSQIRGLR